MRFSLPTKASYGGCLPFNISSLYEPVRSQLAPGLAKVVDHAYPLSLLSFAITSCTFASALLWQPFCLAVADDARGDSLPKKPIRQLGINLKFGSFLLPVSLSRSGHRAPGPVAYPRKSYDHLFVIDHLNFPQHEEIRARETASASQSASKQ
ncbi:hypothetical protein IAR50_003306 [Cryptococcus sp. DSM 104548]